MRPYPIHPKEISELANEVAKVIDGELIDKAIPALILVLRSAIINSSMPLDDAIQWVSDGIRIKLAKKDMH
jgi:hypothetical protein